MRRSEAEDLLFREAELLDTGRLEEWLELTTPDFTYWIPVNREDSDPERHLSIIYDTRADCEERIYRVLESGLNHPQDPPSRTQRIVANVRVESGPRADEVLVRSALLLCATRSGGRREGGGALTLPASCEHRFRDVDGRWMLAAKKVVLLDLDRALPPLTFFV